MAGIKKMTAKYIRGLENEKIINTIKNRFYEKVTIPNKDGCMEWNSSISKNGYGVFTIHPKFIHAHRFAYKFFIGEFSNDLCVLHKCDNRKCVSPEHLFLGDKNLNNKDRANKKRSSINYGAAKLDAKKAKDIRIKIHQGITPYELASFYKVKPATIYNIINNKTWRNI